MAQHPGLTRLLLEHGADPNDEEVPYHSPETYDNTTLKVLIDSGKLSADSLSTMLLRKADFHDREGMRLLLEAGADPNRMTHWRITALHQALRRDNALGHIELLLDHGADPLIKTGMGSRSGVSIAVRRGRADLLAAFQKRGIAPGLEGPEQLLFACAMDDTDGVREIAAKEPAWKDALLAEGGTLLAEFAGTANAGGVAQLLGLGIPVTSLYGGDLYFGIPKNSTALHVAAWKAWPEVVQLLIDRGAPVDALDGNGETPLRLAVRACVDSYWSYRRNPASVQSLLHAGATVKNIPFPSGYDDIDILLRAAGAV
jgi:ankyrin repeat protein